MRDLMHDRDQFDLEGLVDALLSFADRIYDPEIDPTETVRLLTSEDHGPCLLCDAPPDLFQSLREGGTLVFPFTDTFGSARENGELRCADGSILEVPYGEDLEVVVPGLESYDDLDLVGCLVRLDGDHVRVRLAGCMQGPMGGEYVEESDGVGPVEELVPAFLDRFMG